MKEETDKMNQERTEKNEWYNERSESIVQSTEDLKLAYSYAK